MTKIYIYITTYQQKGDFIDIFLISCNLLSIFATMNLISRHIEYLVRYNDCVIIPGWGALIAQYQPSILVDNQLMPPTRNLAFNPSLTHDDGLLASSIVRQKGIGYDQAMKLISDEVNALRHQLEANGEVAISCIGIFTRNNESTMLFTPFSSIATTAQYYGLPKINVTSILSQARSEANEEDSKNSDTIYVPIRRSWTRIAASIAVVLGLGFVLSTPIINDTAHQAAVVTTPTKPQASPLLSNNSTNLVLNIANIDSTESTAIVDTVQRKQYQAVMAYYKQREEQRKARQEEILKQIEEQKKQKEEAAAKEELKQKAQPKAVANVQMRMNNSDKYCVIIASLTSRAQAEKFIATSGNSSLQILEKDGKFRVYAATGATYNQAYSIAVSNGLVNRYKGTWVCRR